MQMHSLWVGDIQAVQRSSKVVPAGACWQQPANRLDLLPCHRQHRYSPLLPRVARRMLRGGQPPVPPG